MKRDGNLILKATPGAVLEDHQKKSENQSISEFILMGFSIGRQIELLLAFLFLTIYITSLGANMVILCIVLVDNRLHNPMYFFLGNVSILDIFFTTVTSPQLLWNLLSGDKSISFAGCMTQSYFYFFLGTVQFLLFTSMSYDRYAAICRPLQYHAIMNSQVCIQMVLACWLGGFLSVLIPTIMISRLSYCKSNVINHFFCDSGPLLNLSCSDTQVIELMDFVLSSVVILCSLILTLVSYVCIISAIVHISTPSGQAKAFNTCASHLTIISISCGISIFIYVTPSQKETLEVHKVPALLTTIVCPFLNPFFFTLQNGTVKLVLRNMMKHVTERIAHKVCGVLGTNGHTKWGNQAKA
ncbi:olfactory receptor 6J1-like isoform X1 [Crotalus tigris]|uniref:olfactory receptor 6J1-like isoform X1 n=2 Tax=Crotalus tigris TaxID=88082 RepID=UPI00192FB45A|nr:olfactory receptor 6J1-like isoform X1 [Crotalus tigris]XP_039206072.1 olfactory receptor 6J1-like isoform X1 [Crotalus tigris]XP_039206073.1 olfactory receptor 6J1-like isoform X1 [Crotalus tigris]XP_039206074.1 olfactory receptor 6J1-like isoform X1 [Crotalus tigris]